MFDSVRSFAQSVSDRGIFKTFSRMSKYVEFRVKTLSGTGSMSYGDHRIVATRTALGWKHTWDGCVLYWDLPSPFVEEITSGQDELFYREYDPRPGDTVLDLGAGSGTELAGLSRRVGKSGRVVAVEASLLGVERCKALVKEMGLANVEVHHRAVHHSSGQVQLWLDGQKGVTNYVRSEEYLSEVSGNFEVVKSLTMDDLMDFIGNPNIDYLKANIEGSEVNIVTNRSLSKVRNWCISCHDFLGGATATFEVVTTRLKAGGVSVCTINGSRGRPWESWYVYATQHLGPDVPPEV